MSRPALFDVNMLVALFDPEHVHHDVAHDWFSEEKDAGWVTCPVTENGLVRIISDPSYPGVHTPALTALELLRRFCASDGHAFWPDDFSLRDIALDAAKSLRSKHTTDLYLLALAARHGGRLITFDKSIPLTLLKGATREHLEVLSLA